MTLCVGVNSQHQSVLILLEVDCIQVPSLVV